MEHCVETGGVLWNVVQVVSATVIARFRRRGIGTALNSIDNLRYFL